MKKMERIVKTCFGEFSIVGDIATCILDDDFYYHLPSVEMTDDEIKDYFLELQDFEQ